MLLEQVFGMCTAEALQPDSPRGVLDRSGMHMFQVYPYHLKQLRISSDWDMP